MAQELVVCQGLLNIEVSRSHSDTAHSVGLLWTSAETSTWQHTTLTPCPHRDSNTQSRQARGSNPRLGPRVHWNRPEIRNNRKISCPRATWSNKKPNNNWRSINPGLREEKSATSRLLYGTVQR